MVRVISQNFSPPRSRHSSGETDRDLAERANSALSTLGRKRFEIPEYESSSDSFWDSEFDGDHVDTQFSEAGSERDDINGNELSEKSDVQSRRKERRRERNKLSAQAYRQRRRHQSAKDQQQLMSLEAENRRLQKLVQTLEKKTEQAKQHLRGRSVPMPDILVPEGGARVTNLSILAGSQGSGPDPCDPAKTAKLATLGGARFKEKTSATKASDLLSRLDVSKDSPSSAPTGHPRPVLTSLSPDQPSLPAPHPPNANLIPPPHNDAAYNMLSTNAAPDGVNMNSQTQSAAPTPVQLFINANTLFSVQLPTCPVPAYLTVPVKNASSGPCPGNSNLNFNLPPGHLNESPLSTDQSAALSAPPVVSTTLSPGSTDSLPINENTVRGLTCNNNNNNINKNFNFFTNMNSEFRKNRNSCDNTSAMQSFNSRPVPFNLNLSPIAESADRQEQGNEARGQDTAQSGFLPNYTSPPEKTFPLSVQ